MSFGRNKSEIPSPEQALSGRDTAMQVSQLHAVNGNSIKPPFPAGYSQFLVGLGCFWGAERLFWQTLGVYTTAVGYAGGYTPNPTYQEVCSGMTGHNEVVLVVFNPAEVSFNKLLTIFWEAHDPTQGMRQGNDSGTQYRSGLYLLTDEQVVAAEQSLKQYQAALSAAGRGEITTEIKTGVDFYYAETYHQQYLAKNPNGYCGLAGTGVSCASTA
ncbi:peptide-methionine (S)-S-oxide reductase MsrA [Gilvimarinus polysaccharolyticus]|uniref:peptide-methionine (S)-S-oxide reductase MsrA n=1 Tax=Gilvimarinus polysaccharolyticus TaxID=863921 RepID=UPI000673A892|nr:peptide-methionine (S)-S-oxide reductase MsrA [Gilvimarinus polysaccharolyticus]